MGMQPRVTWFSEEDRQKIVDEAKQLLETVGVFVENAEAVALLDGAGARVEKDTRRVFIPMRSAQPSSLSIVFGSHVDACHISIWLMAVAG